MGWYRRRLLHGHDLEESGKDKLAHGTLLDVQFNHVCQPIEDGRDLLAAEISVFSDGVQDLRLGVLFLSSRWFLCHGLFGMSCVENAHLMPTLAAFNKLFFEQTPFFLGLEPILPRLGALPRSF